MTALERRVNMAAVFTPFVVVALAIPLLWGNLLGWSDTARGIDAFYDRALTMLATHTGSLMAWAASVTTARKGAGSPAA